MIDDLLLYEHTSYPGTPKDHETRKRTLGLELAREAGASHCLSLDVDEFYALDALTRAKDFIERKGYDVTACRVQDYHSRSIYRRVTLAKYLEIDLYVPFIYRVTNDTEFICGGDFFCCVDPSRRLPYARPFIFPVEEVVMHHMTTVRRDRRSLISKFVNSSSRPFVALEHPEDLAELIWRFDPYKDCAPRVRLVPDEFGIGVIQQRVAKNRY